MKKYLIVMHFWFVSSECWEKVSIEAKDREEAYQKGSAIAYSKQSWKKNVDFQVFELADEKIVNPRRYSFIKWLVKYFRQEA
jgi:hypothetical protein